MSQGTGIKPNLDRGSLAPTYIKPFDVFANRGKTGDWLAKLGSN
jgi:hypothetical protein